MSGCHHFRSLQPQARATLLRTASVSCCKTIIMLSSTPCTRSAAYRYWHKQGVQGHSPHILSNRDGLSCDRDIGIDFCQAPSL